MLIDISPLKRNRDYRYLYFGQFISFFGAMLTYVAIPYQIYQLTESTLAVGLIGIVELVPLLCTAFIGGALADVVDRKKLLIRTEIAMAVSILLLVFNSLLLEPHIWLIFILAGLLSGLNGLHRPSLDAMTPRLVTHEEIKSVSALSALKSTISMIGGPAAAGIAIANFGLTTTYLIDFATFAFSIAALLCIKSMGPLEKQETPSFKSVKEGIKYATSRQELLGTYIVDIAAMIFAWPNALFPAIAQAYSQTKVLGWLYSAPAIGALIVTIFSGWTLKVQRHGAAVIIAALCWGLSILAFGFSEQLLVVLFFLGLAGAADSVSGIFRSTIWNETIPDRLRGRMAGLEMISYMSGPLLGNAWAGFLASITGIDLAIIIGGSLCVTGVAFAALLLPRFWSYQSNNKLE
jgi:MFS family permease